MIWIATWHDVAAVAVGLVLATAAVIVGVWLTARHIYVSRLDTVIDRLHGIGEACPDDWDTHVDDALDVAAGDRLTVVLPEVDHAEVARRFERTYRRPWMVGRD